MEDGEGVSLSRVASRYSAVSVTMAGTLVRTEMDPVPKLRVTPLLETQQIGQWFAAFGQGKVACQSHSLSLLRTHSRRDCCCHAQISVD